MKNLIALLMIVCLGVFIVGCGEEGGGGESSESVPVDAVDMDAEVKKAMDGSKDMPGTEDALKSINTAEKEKEKEGSSGSKDPTGSPPAKDK